MKEHVLNRTKEHIHCLKIDIEQGMVLNRRTYINGSGYMCFSLKNRVVKVHQVVAIAGGLDVLNKDINHIDGNKLNNRLDNLEVITRSENIKHAWANKLFKGNSK